MKYSTIVKYKRYFREHTFKKYLGIHVCVYTHIYIQHSMVVIIQNSDPGSWIIPQKKHRGTCTHLSNRVEIDQERQNRLAQQEKFKKILGKYWKSQILIARQHFSMVLLWRQLRTVGIFRGSSIELDRPDVEATFSRLPKTGIHYYALFRLLRASAVQKV